MQQAERNTTPSALRPRRGDAARVRPEIRPFREGDWPAVARYYETRYRPGYILSRRDYFDWCFGSPHALADDHGQRLVVDESRPDGDHVVGIGGTMAWPLQAGGEQAMASCTINILLDRDYRKGTLGYRLMKEASLRFPYTVAIGVRPVVLQTIPHAGPAISFEMRRWVRVLGADTCADLARRAPSFERADASGREAALALVAEAAAASDSSAQAEGYSLERVARFGPEWDEAWAGVRAGYGTTTWRSAAFLNWRYGAYPFAIYETHVLRDGGGRITGFVALREERPAFGAVLRVVDAVAAPGALGALLALVEAEARRRRVAFVDFMIGGRADTDALRAAGYRTLDIEEGGGCLLPADLNPVRWRDRPIAAMFCFPPGHGGLDDVLEEVESGSFFFTKADGDLDRAF